MTTLEKLAYLGEIEISNCPDTGAVRIAKLDNGMLWFPCAAKQIILKLVVYYVDKSQRRYQPYDITLTADNTVKVDGELNVLTLPVPIIEDEVTTNQADIDAYNEAPTEYQAVMSMALTTPSPELCVMFIQMRDLQGKFNP